jgi:predicted small metal-binding protein
VEEAMQQFACAQVVDGCDGVVTGETEDEVVAAAARHAADSHGLTEVSPQLERQIRAGITQV